MTIEEDALVVGIADSVADSPCMRMVIGLGPASMDKGQTPHAVNRAPTVIVVGDEALRVDRAAAGASPADVSMPRMV